VLWSNMVLVSVGVVGSASWSSGVVDMVVDMVCELVCVGVCACCDVCGGEVDNVGGIVALMCDVGMVGFGGGGVGFVVAI
jgi:hypothetical protein